MSGIHLGDMDMSDMVDVVHYFFETDATSISSGEQQEARDEMRTLIYRTFYNAEYKYGASKSKNSNLIPAENEDFEVEDLPAPFDPLQGAAKQYTPATSFDPDAANPFGSVLDAPLK